MNREMKKTVFVVALMTLVVAGCAPWRYIGKEGTTWGQGPFTGTLPTGWVKMDSDMLLLTRSGTSLEKIEIIRYAVDKELPINKKKFTVGMLPQEAAQVLIDEMTLDKTMNNFQVIENRPVKLGEVPAFKLILTFNNDDGKKSRTILYGFVMDKWLYEIRYIAAQQHYFDSSVKDFETFVLGLQIKAH